MNWTVSIKSKARKSLDRFPKKDYLAISAGIKALEANPFIGDVEKMKGEESHKLRIGNYRIMFDLNFREKILYVYEIKRRTTTTYRKR
ncbi:MAG: hypothetical protein A3D92_09215 [Bacteroidetes bacterium RIFCSPHIGHO2_02_FULL_44_7]|nr:MAG: hypothetical protein A3D92_09215 [Bacteroidetes bacterium RIFCSPHIGHO2_02_FULL_44_7]